MYRYDEQDKKIVEERAAQFRDQVNRRLEGAITENEFKPLRLQNGLYMQLHAYMMRVAIPYGLLSSEQLKKLAHIARTYDKRYAHFTTRQNIQYNWPELEDVPTILAELAEVEMHAIQTSGNCVRNVTSDPYAGVAADELEDPRPYCEMLRQWSTFHPEFAALPRKFKIAVTGAAQDRAAIAAHDIGLRIVEKNGERGFQVLVGGGLGRTPILGATIREFLPKQDLLSYVEAILRVYNRFGRRDNKYKARVKILVKALGPTEFGALVEEEWSHIKDGVLKLTDVEIERMRSHFSSPDYEVLPDSETAIQRALLSKDRNYAAWVRANVVRHRVDGYAIAVISLKSDKLPPGDVTDSQMDAIADIASRYSLGQLRVTHRQNLVLADVKASDLPTLHAELERLHLATPNFGKITDIIACPGLDYCALANARAIPVAEDISARFQDMQRLYDIGDLTLNISGCINACGHHHIGNIGILGIDKRGVEYYQLMVGGCAEDDASLGKTLGPAFRAEEIADAVERLVEAYLQLRDSKEETFLHAYRRLGPVPFKEIVYGTDQESSDRSRRLAASIG